MFVMEKDFKQLKMNGFDGESEVVTLSVFDVNFEKVFNNLKIQYKKNGVVCFTGNRPTGLPWQYNEDCELFKEFKTKLEKIIQLFIENGYTKFITGMAMGFDLISAEIVLKIKEENKNIYLECAVPCLNQTRGWTGDYITRYQKVLDKADNVVFTSNYAYFDGCYMVRNRYLVDSSDFVLGCQIKHSAGTKSTLDYARKKQKNIIILQ